MTALLLFEQRGSAPGPAVAFASLLTSSPLVRESLREMPYIVGATWAFLVYTARFLGSSCPISGAPARIGSESARRDEDGR